jgi:lipopolysaccharide transport system ATP-binding protein
LTEAPEFLESLSDMAPRHRVPDATVRVEGLGKMYRIGVQSTSPSGSGRRVLAALASPFDYLRRSLRPPSEAETLWALRDVSIEVAEGEILGIIGRNGAGKSTLLKILSRITEPTEGRALIRGRLASLLEVGTGFHPELTGRENIFLSGAILGMSKTDVERNFDAIASFAGVEGFLDTPVKRYSSGMYVRLGFAVAAHLESEVLLIDEVLAVGDVAFQRKALTRMGDVVRQGRTVLFVSHNLVAVQSLCTVCAWLDGGRLVALGDTATVVARYLAEYRVDDLETSREWSLDSAPGTDAFKFLSVAVRPEGDRHSMIAMDTAFTIEIEFHNFIEKARLHVTIHVIDEKDQVVFSTDNTNAPHDPSGLYGVGTYRVKCHVPGHLMNAGYYHVRCLAGIDRSIIYRLEQAVRFEIVDTSVREGAWFGRDPGAVRPLLQWSTEPLGTAPS